MSPATMCSAREALRFPRVSGDEPIRPARGLLIDRFSPRERG